MERISREQVRKTAHLGRVFLTDEEVDRFAPQLGDILAYVEKLAELDTGAVEPLDHVLPLRNVMREDAARPSLGADLALREAPERHEDFFKVPKVLGEGAGA
jgi:aspartyl-tRNA(Asn)/glutamyl-tRNA(Gln) amidotransferase subunit C